VTVLAPAKVNFTLEVLARRPDGYHEIRSVMQAISLCDKLTLEVGDGITLDGGNEDAPPDRTNLVYRAAAALDQAAGGGHGARIVLDKRIPAGAGLGGGSSDAAATLLGLNALWSLDFETERLMAIGATLGSDVPFFLTAGTALAEGRGERLTPLPPPPRLWMVVAKPAESLSTPFVYREADARGAYGAGAPAAWPPRDVAALAGRLQNGLAESAFALCPSARRLRDELLCAGALGALLSGSGSAVLGLASDEAHARRMQAEIEMSGIWAIACHTVALPWKGDE
jgi:4-diphosphocytidyl-2-C-methyl-D-erythritol kinase